MSENKIEVASIKATARRCRQEGIPLGEYTLRRMVRSGELPATKIGKNDRAIINWEDIQMLFVTPQQNEERA